MQETYGYCFRPGQPATLHSGGPVCNIVNHANRPDDFSILVAKVLALFMDQTDFAGRTPDHPVFNVICVSTQLDRAEVSSIDSGTIFRMDRFQKSLVGGRKLLGLEPKDAIHLVGPGQAIVYKVQFPASQMSNFLRAPEPPLTLAQCLFSKFAIRNVTQDRKPAAYSINFQKLHRHTDQPGFT